MQTLRTTTTVLALAALATISCGKDDGKGSAKPPAPAPEAKADKPAPAPEAAKPAAEPAGDYIYVWASHAEPKPTDPVKIVFSEFRVTAASFDPGNLAGATAQLEIDLASLSSGVDKRDGHLKTPDYLAVAEHPKAIISVADVANKQGSVYSANAEVTAHGVTKTLPVEFEVVASDATSVTIKASHAFQRTDFGIGQAEGDSSATEVTIEMRLTLRKS